MGVPCGGGRTARAALGIVAVHTHGSAVVCHGRSSAARHVYAGVLVCTLHVKLEALLCQPTRSM
eukprot:1491646-Pyramimonas_sp.AAC.1